MSSRAQAGSRVHGGAVARLRRTPLFGWRRVVTVAAAVLTGGVGYHVVFGQNGLTSYEHKRQESRNLAREARALAKENEFYRGHVSRLQSDPGAIEHQAREELHYTRPGEVIYTLPPDASPARQQR